MPVTVDVDISEFDDDEVIEEAKRRGLWERATEDALFALMQTLGVPDELQLPIKDWLAWPVATPEKLKEWIKIS